LTGWTITGIVGLRTLFSLKTIPLQDFFWRFFLFFGMVLSQNRGYNSIELKKGKQDLHLKQISYREPEKLLTLFSGVYLVITHGNIMGIYHGQNLCECLFVQMVPKI